MNNTPRLKKLFEPGRIGTMTVPNRIVMAPMGTEYGAFNGMVTERIKDYYEARAKGGVGLIIVEATSVDTPVGRCFAGQLSIDDDRFISGLAELAGVIRKHGSKCALQIQHAGLVAYSAITGHQPVGPSILNQRGYEPPHVLTTEEIERIVLKFGQAALRARKAGFDGVEIHGAHDYLLAEFLSAIWNSRQDDYGGSLKNRARLLCQVIRTCREMIGAEYPLWVRLNSYEMGLAGAMTLEDAKKIAPMVEAAGADAIHVSCWGWGRYALENLPSIPGYFVSAAEEIKRVVKIPVIAVGRIEPKLGDILLRDGRADFVAIGRALLSDPDLPGKAAAGRLQDINPCISCWRCLEQSGMGLMESAGLKCSTNAAVGRERESELTRADRIKKVLVAGGGPAGMEAARVAALRGHRVTLCERGQRLGGQLLLAETAGKQDRIQLLTHYLEKQIRDLGVQVELGCNVTLELVRERQPDAVVLATGVRPLLPDLPGVDRPNVVNVIDLLSGKAHTGHRVVVIGAERVGLKAAEYLASQGKEVTVTRRGKYIASKIAPFIRRPLIDRLRDSGIIMMKEVQYHQITDAGLEITDAEGKKRVLQADTIVLASGAAPENHLARALEGRVPELHLAGDCVSPRDILSAVSEGFRIGRNL